MLRVPTLRRLHPQAVKQRLVAPVFEQIHQHASSSWSATATARSAAGAPSPAPGMEQAATAAAAASDAEVPIVLLSIGASADHAHTCPDLVHFLRQQVSNRASSSRSHHVQAYDAFENTKPP